MKIQFETWLFETEKSPNVTILFEESIKSYKNSAYRASLLFSYLGLLTIIKELIIKSLKPVSIVQTRWDCIILKLQNDDLWEKTVYEEIINSSAPIFNIDDDIRQQFKYWKDRRNDCAHFKDNEIEFHHTESFWSFIKSNLSKITIEGGMESLLKKFELHFNPTFTPPDSNYDELVLEIENAIEDKDLIQFWQELLSRIDQYGFLFNNESSVTKVYKRVFEICPERVKDYLSEYLKAKNNDLTIIGLYPELLNSFKYSISEIRSIWRVRIFQSEYIAFTIYSALLRNSLIPATQINESMEYILEKLTGYKPKNDEEHFALASNGFGETIFNLGFVTKRLQDWYMWVNPRADLLLYYIEKYPLKNETVEIICEMYTRDKYSFWLSERIENLFKEKTEKKAEFHQIANQKGFTIPTKLT